jgi:hypothetical protein
MGTDDWMVNRRVWRWVVGADPGGIRDSRVSARVIGVRACSAYSVEVLRLRLNQNRRARAAARRLKSTGWGGRRTHRRAWWR